MLLTLRVVFGLVAVLSVQLLPIRSMSGDWLELVIRGGEPWSRFLSTWQRWDALWYQRIAEHGYRAGDGTTAFYPLFPLLSRAISLPLGGHIVWAQLIVSSVAFLVAAWLLYRLARLDVGPLAAHLTVLLLTFFPTGFFLLAPYTESLFLALTVAAFWLARTGRPWAAGLVGFAAGLTRFQGALLVLPLAFEYLRQRGEAGKRPGWALLAATLPPLGLIVVTAFFRFVVGERRSPLGTQGQWGYRLVPPWEALSASWAHITARGDLIEALNLVCLLGFAMLTLAGLRRLPLSYSLYALPSVGLLCARQLAFLPLMSVSRYVLVLFPCFLLVALWLARRPWLAAGWLVLSAGLELLLLVYFVHWGFVA